MSEGEDLGNEENLDPEFSDVEVEAIDKGWNPEGVDGRRNLSAEEFMERQPLYDKIHRSERAVKRMQDSQSALQQHLETLQESINKQRVDDLKVQKRVALKGEEFDRVMEIDEQIIDIHAEPAAPAQQPPDTTVFDDWAEQNTWYDSDTQLKRYADAVGAEYAKQYGTLDSSVLAKVTAEVKSAFPDKFTATRTRPSPVEGASRATSRVRAPNYTVKDLDSDTLNVMKTLVRDGTYGSESEYIKALEQSGYFS